MNSMHRALPLLVLLLFAACGIDPVAEPLPVDTQWEPGAVPCPGHEPTFDPHFSAVEWPEAAARALCDRTTDCCLTSVAAYEACVARERRDIGARSLEARIAAGLVTIDLARARECLRAYAEDHSCSPKRRTLRCIAEPGIVRPAVGAGGRCIDNGDCISGMCVRQDGACGGICAPSAAVGELCDPTSLPCDRATGWCPPPGISPVRRCLPLRGEGESCPLSEACVEGTWCGGGICRKPIAEGEACVERLDRCAAGLSCVGGVCAREGWQREGAPCDSTEDCADGLRCEAGDEGLRCVQVRFSGERCSSGADCSVIGFCHPLGWCAPKRGQFEPCETGAWCSEGLLCIDGECRPPPDAGGRCSEKVPCRLPLLCRDGRCALPAAIGDACATAYDCESGRCVEGLCAPLLREGERCARSADCASRACEEGVDGVKRCAAVCVP